MNERVTFAKRKSTSQFRMLLNFSKKLLSIRFAVMKNDYLKRRMPDDAVTLLISVFH